MEGPTAPVIVTVTVLDEASGVVRAWPLDAADALTLSLAIAAHGRLLERQGMELPAALEGLRLASSARSRSPGPARARQDPTSGCAIDGGVEDGSQLLLDKSEAAQVLNVSVRTIERWASSGELVSVRLGSLVRFRRDDVVGLAEGKGA